MELNLNIKDVFFIATQLVIAVSFVINTRVATKNNTEQIKGLKTWILSVAEELKELRIKIGK